MDENRRPSGVGLDSTLQSLADVFDKTGEESLQVLDETVLLPPAPRNSVGTAELRALVHDDRVKNLELEVERLSRLLENEMRCAQEKKRQLEDQIRALKRSSRKDVTVAVPRPREGGVLAGSYRIAVTGGPAVGKRELGKVLTHLGALVIDVDDVLASCNCAARGTPLHTAVVEEFGPAALDGSGRVRPDRLVAEAAGRLEQLVTPAVVAQCNRRIGAASASVVALVSGWLPDCVFNAVFAVVAPRSAQLARLAARGVSAADAGLLLERTAPRVAALMERATAIMSNAGPLEELRRQTVRAWRLIPQAAAPRSAPPVACLVPVDATLPLLELYEGAEVSIGRSDRCTVQVCDATVSHDQCCVFVRDGAVFLDDQSTHGTFVGQKKVGHRMRVQLKHGDTVTLSKLTVKAHLVHYVVHLDDCTEVRTLRFPAAGAGRTMGSMTPKWVEKCAKHGDEKVAFYVNVRTGETSTTRPE